MRKDFGAKPFLYPQPVLMIATYGEDGTPDVMNAAWGGIADMKRVAMYLSASHKTVKNILARKAFTVSMADADHVVPCDQECPCGRPAGRRAAPGPGVPVC